MIALTPHAQLELDRGLHAIHKHADRVCLSMEPTPIFAAVVAEVGAPAGGVR